jgi:hypothetical protein
MDGEIDRQIYRCWGGGGGDALPDNVPPLIFYPIRIR